MLDFELYKITTRIDALFLVIVIVYAVRAKHTCQTRGA